MVLRRLYGAFTVTFDKSGGKNLQSKKALNLPTPLTTGAQNQATHAVDDRSNFLVYLLFK